MAWLRSEVARKFCYSPAETLKKLRSITHLKKIDFFGLHCFEPVYTYSLPHTFVGFNFEDTLNNVIESHELTCPFCYKGYSAYRSTVLSDLIFDGHVTWGGACGDCLDEYFMSVWVNRCGFVNKTGSIATQVSALLVEAAKRFGPSEFQKHFNKNFKPIKKKRIKANGTN